MAIKLPQKLPEPGVRWIGIDGKLTPEAFRYLSDMDKAIRVLIRQYNTDNP